MSNKNAKFTIRMDFEDNATVALLFGEHNQNLMQIEDALDVKLDSFGNSIKISGASAASKEARKVIETLYKTVRDAGAEEIDKSMVSDALRWESNSKATPKPQALESIDTWKKKIVAKTSGQNQYLDLLRRDEVVFGLGPAGTGKTYMAVARAVEALKKREVERIVLSRPAVEAGERLGFLPGDMKEKVDPYLRPLYDALYDMMPADKVDRMLTSGEIEIAPLAFMRGRTLSASYVIIDEAQNTTPVQMKMVLTRLGQDSRMVITGDLSQVDLPAGHPSGLADAVSILTDIKGVGIIHLSGKDVVRHPVVARILHAYEKGQTP
ncbi:PhoH family protein [Candidatus Puniceispirillum marinum]|uniref:PhoH-like protein n=1 Tax=Puniceispirillum marinum (strain IMCC1322) TaxID=488538 RepID=D5BU85_PUNMI|nr:PhoH family protein [Candidatus Puniceispirillum marinum]ADE39832.1 PhoH family protein [Candidatus Puniceispirillum marinum IMCC1322]